MPRKEGYGGATVQLFPCGGVAPMPKVFKFHHSRAMIWNSTQHVAHIES
jgi:hypothetical protein